MKERQASQTAARVALTRAMEARRPQKVRICSDDMASLFLTGPLTKILNSPVHRILFTISAAIRMPGVIGAVLARTRFMDDILNEAVNAGIRQVVILGAGYDTRAIRFRLRNRGVRVFEADHPATLERKLARLKALPARFREAAVHVPVHFHSNSLLPCLISAGYQPNIKTLFIWEGVTYYIEPAAADLTFRFVTAHSGAGSSLVFDFLPPSVADGTSRIREARAMQSLFSRIGESITFGIDPSDLPGFLRHRGFIGVRLFTGQDLKKRYFTGINRVRRVSNLFGFAHARV